MDIDREEGTKLTKTEN